MNIRYLIVVFCTLILLIGCYSSIFVYALGNTGRPDSYIKELIASSINEPKVLIIGGSSSIHGIDNKRLEQKLGLPVVNMAFAASLSIDYRVFQVDKNSNPGDIVIMPLEWEYYFREDDNTEHYKSTLRYFSDYFYSLPLFGKAETLLHTSPKFVIDEAHKVFTSSDLLSKERKNNTAVLDQFLKHLKRCPKNIPCVDIYGGLSNSSVLSSKIDIQKGPKEGYVVSDRFKKTLKNLAVIEKEKSIKIVFAFPPYLPGPDFFTFTERDGKDFLFLQEVRNEMSKHGFQLPGNATNYIYNIDDMLDTRYHLKERMRKQHTDLLLKDIADELSLNELKCGNKSTRDYMLKSVFNQEKSIFANKGYNFYPIALLDDNKHLPSLNFKEATFSVAKGIEVIKRDGMSIVNGFSNKPSIQLSIPEKASGKTIILEMKIELPEQRKWHFFYRGQNDKKFSHTRRVDFEANIGKQRLLLALNPTEIQTMLRIDYGSTVGKFLIGSIRITTVDSNQLEEAYLQDWKHDAICKINEPTRNQTSNISM